ncbi:hypothetical protein GCM10009548_02160 [Streptomyces malaysiensis subsp. malaysiensis]|uniref:Uncharacterized protein n=1 Tax=Streptomyces malaysiensis TaxID=92644 RepID=A0ABX6W951_STRMQ|nr:MULTISPECIES: hypothetical protein [Streptomyces]QPI56321.1 hypothetical protein I1A49_16470 [Streptomyces solisilvae]UHH17806.1 hypothetical protein LUV23_16585 [Streptomyces sp. HNM0561]
MSKPHGLDLAALDKALRWYVAELDYDTHKNLECGEEDGEDHYAEEVDYFVKCYQDALNEGEAD